MLSLISEHSELLFWTPLFLFGFLEEWKNRRPSKIPYRGRWLSNFGLLALNRYGIYFLMPTGLVFVANIFQSNIGGGIFAFIPRNNILAVIVYLFCYDLLNYLIHRVFHTIPFLWKIHRVHHSDLDFDISTSVRHHPFESWVTDIITQLFIALMGAPVEIVIFCGLVESFASAFNHTNLMINSRLEQGLRWLIVTPDMHSVHHSAYRPETDSNFSNIFSFWDRLFGTYCASPALGYDQFTLGLDKFRDNRDQKLAGLLLNPFKK